MANQWEATITKQETHPSDFPMPTVFTEEQLKERSGRKVKSPYDEYQFYFKNGQLDKEWITNMWYGLRGKTWDPNYHKPEDIEINSFGQFLYDHISFREIFEQSSAFQNMMSRPENDPKQEQVIDFMTNLITRTFGNELRAKIAKISGLSEKINIYMKNEIQDAFSSYREKDKWGKNVDDLISKDQPEEVKKILSARDENRKLEREIGEILTKEKLWSK